MTTPTLHPIRNIVLAIDGSEHAMAAVKLIQNLPLPETCSITLLSVLIPRNAQHFSHLEHLLEQTEIRLRTEGLQVNSKLLTGYPAEQIISYAKEHQPDLLVMGAKGLRGTIRILLGGVAQQVVEYAPCPVLIVRAPHVQAKRVLLVTDGSEHSRYAIQHIQQCPLPSDAHLTVLHVLHPEITPEMLIRSWPYGMEVVPSAITPDIGENLEQRAKNEEEQGEALLRRTSNLLRKMGITFTTVLKRGDAATEILEFAEENQINLIIAGSRGLSQIQNWFLGSVSNKLTHYAECSVLIVKKP